MACYLNAIEHVSSSIKGHNTNMIEENVKYVSLKRKKKKNKSFGGENHTVAVLEPKKVKKKDVPKGENIFEVHEGEMLDILPSHFQDRSSVLIEPIDTEKCLFLQNTNLSSN